MDFFLKSAENVQMIFIFQKSVRLEREWYGGSERLYSEMEETVKSIVEKFKKVNFFTHQERLTIFHSIVAYLYFYAELPLTCKSTQSITIHSAAHVVYEFIQHPEKQSYRLEVEPFESNYISHIYQ